MKRKIAVNTPQAFGAALAEAIFCLFLVSVLDAGLWLLDLRLEGNYTWVLITLIFVVIIRWLAGLEYREIDLDPPQS